MSKNIDSSLNRTVEQKLKPLFLDVSKHIDTKLNDTEYRLLETLRSVSPSSVIENEYPRTLASVCGINAEPKLNQLGLYPPSNGKTSDYLNRFGNMTVGVDGNEATVTSGIHPEGFPPFFGACNAAKDSLQFALQTCQIFSNQATSNANRFRELTSTYGFLFSIVLQLEYFASMNVPQQRNFGSQWLENILLTNFTVRNGPYTNGTDIGLKAYFESTLANMLLIVSENANIVAFQPFQQLTQVFLDSIGRAGFINHLIGAINKMYDRSDSVSNATGLQARSINSRIPATLGTVLDTCCFRL